VVAKVVDSETGEVVREVPPEELLELARRVTALVGAMFDRRV
jgi:flagellar protein FlaG